MKYGRLLSTLTKENPKHFVHQRSYTDRPVIEPSHGCDRRSRPAVLLRQFRTLSSCYSYCFHAIPFSSFRLFDQNAVCKSNSFRTCCMFHTLLQSFCRLRGLQLAAFSAVSSQNTYYYFSPLVKLRVRCTTARFYLS
jgi:hypothetical protein